MKHFARGICIIAVIFFAGCNQSQNMGGNEVDMNDVRMQGIDDSSYLLEIEGVTVETERSFEVQKAQLQVLMGEDVHIPFVKRAWRTTSRDYPFVVLIGDRLVLAKSINWAPVNPAEIVHE